MDDVPTNAPNAPGFFPPPGGDETTPKSGLDALAQDAGQDNGTLPLAPVGGGATIFQRLSASNSPHLQKLSTSTTKALQDPNAAKPGGWARALVGGAIDALGGGLGDAAAVGTIPSGGGALTGIARTMAARGERVQKQRAANIEADYKKAQMAEIQARTVSTMQNIYRQDKEDRDKSYSQNAAMVAGMKDDHDVQENITQSKLQQMMKDDKDFWQTHVGGATSERPVMDGDGKPVFKNGKQVYEPMYAVANIASKTGRPGKHELTKSEADYFNRNGVTDKPVQEGTTVDTITYAGLYKKAHGTEDVSNAIEKANDGKLAEAQADAVRDDLQDPAVQRYAMMVPGDPLAGLYKAGKNIDAHIASLDQQIAVMQKRGNDPTAQSAAGALQQKKQQFQDEEKKITNVITNGFTQDAKEKYQKAIEEDRKQTEIERHNKADEANKAQEIKNKGLLDSDNPQDQESVAESMVDADMDPSQLSKRSKSYNATLAKAKAYSLKKYGKPFDIAQAQTDYRYANRGQTKDTLNMVRGMIEDNGSLSILQSAAKGLPQLNEQTVNKLFNAGDQEFGDHRITDVHTALLGFADEYAKVMGAGTGSDLSRQQALDILKDYFSKGQVEGMFKTVNKDLGARSHAMIKDNRYLKKEYNDLIDTYKNSFVPETPKGAANPKPGQAADKTPVWRMTDGSVQDAQGNKYDPKSGQKLQVQQ